MNIAPKELPLIGPRLQIQLEKYGINLDTNKFEAMIREDNGEKQCLILASFHVKSRIVQNNLC